MKFLLFLSFLSFFLFLRAPPMLCSTANSIFVSSSGTVRAIFLHPGLRLHAQRLQK
jgi:hypothetical protein